VRRTLVLALVILLAAAAYVAFGLMAPYDAFGRETFVDLPKGTNTAQMARLLANAGVIRQGWSFLLARAMRRGVTLQAGEYRFTKPASVLEIFDRIARGDIFFYELTVPEGKNMFDIAAAANSLGLFPEAAFLEVARNPALIRDLDPQAPTLEGYLFPNTYRLSRHTTPQVLCRMMTDKFREVWAALHTDAEPHRVVTLASLVEKEGKLAEERPVIASVFLRRLAIGMKLDCDPTTIYAALLSGRYRGGIYRSDLESRDPYNTYQHAGLPPGPIANPGLASIQAVLHPADAEYLYFVARPDGSGGHSFSKDLAAQQAAIAKYRRSLTK
jgi:UPF0755 protein